MLILFSLSRQNISTSPRDLALRTYSTGAERLWYRVSWERAIGHVIVIDPFDPSTLLYLPGPQYHDLVKTALANKTPLTVVHSLEDPIPEERDLLLNEHTYRAFYIDDVEVKGARHLKNTPPLSSDTARRMIKELQDKTSALRYDIKAEASGSWLSLVPQFLRSLTVPSLLWGDIRKSEIRFPDSKSVGHDGDLSDEFDPKRRPLDGYLARVDSETWTQYHKRYIASFEATLLGRYAWAGATLLARSGRCLNWVAAILKEFIHLWQHNGLKTACAVFAEARRLVYKFAAETPESVSLPVGLCVGIEDGLPTILPRGLRRYIRNNSVTAYRVAIFALSVCDLLLYKEKPKWVTIVGPYTGAQPLDCGAFEQEVREAARSLRGRYGAIAPPRFRGLHLTTKAGPYGTALASAPLDALALECSPIYGAWRSLASGIGAHALIQQVTWIAWLTRRILQLVPTYHEGWFLRARPGTPLMKFYKKFWVRNRGIPIAPFSRLLGTLPTGKVSEKLEARGKVRLFAIPGYWIQAVLRPLHDSIFDLLKVLPRDNTFDQLAGVVRMADSGAKRMWSYDLSAATDRFPLRIQQIVLEEFLELPKTEAVAVAKYWREILEGLQFSSPKVRGLIRYAIGQPMGSYSSWACFTLAHHTMVELAHRRAGKSEGHTDEFLSYELLGDDIGIYGDTPHVEKVACAYYDLMESVGVKINPNKGIVSSNGSFEFAKRFVRQGSTLTCLKWRELASCTSNASFLALLKRFKIIVGHIPHLRCALEVYHALIFGVPIQRSLHRITSSAFSGLTKPYARFGVIIILLTGPTGPYMSTFIDWLSGRAIALADFHPNIGRYINGKKTMYAIHARVAAHVVGIFQRLQHELVTRLLKGTPLSAKIFTTFARVLNNGPDSARASSLIALNYATNTQFSGFLRTLIQSSPGYLTVSRAVKDLVDFGIQNELFVAESNEYANLINLHPDREFIWGELPPLWQNIPYDQMLSSPCPPDHNVATEYLDKITLSICKFISPLDSLAQLKEAGSLSALASAKVNNILPSALPAYGDELLDLMSNFEAKAVLRMFRKLRSVAKLGSVPYSALGPTPGVDLASLPCLSLFDDIRIAWKEFKIVPPEPEFISIDQVTPGLLDESTVHVFPMKRRETMSIPIAADKQTWSLSDQAAFETVHPATWDSRIGYTGIEGPEVLGVPPVLV